MTQAEHDLGNHSGNHKKMSQLSDKEKKEELMQVHIKVQELTGYDMIEQGKLKNFEYNAIYTPRTFMKDAD